MTTREPQIPTTAPPGFRAMFLVGCGHLDRAEVRGKRALRAITLRPSSAVVWLTTRTSNWTGDLAEEAARFRLISFAMALALRSGLSPLVADRVLSEHGR
jgi:hypothetical protein